MRIPAKGKGLRKKWRHAGIPAGCELFTAASQQANDPFFRGTQAHAAQEALRPFSLATPTAASDVDQPPIPAAPLPLQSQAFQAYYPLALPTDPSKISPL
jgi:hypothetical protein